MNIEVILLESIIYVEGSLLLLIVIIDVVADCSRNSFNHFGTYSSLLFDNAGWHR